MPRNRAVDYPQVPHRPTTTVPPQLGLAPPPSFAAENRFSFLDTPIEAVSPNADQLFEAANAARRQQPQRQSSVPPLPILPEHLSDGGQQAREPTQAVLPSQRRDLALAQAQQEQQQQQQQQVQSAAQFRPDVPRLHQQLQQQARPHHQSPTPTYEQSQSTYRQSQQHQTRMQEQAAYSGPYNGQHAQLSAHVLPARNTHHMPTVEEPQQSEEEKTPLPDENRWNAPRQPQQLKPVHFGPDENPLSPTTPRSVTCPATTTTNIRPMPAMSVPADSYPFPQSTVQQQPERGGTWHHSLYSCSFPTTCLISLFCPCIIYGRTQHRLSLKSAGKDPTNMLGSSSINGSCIAWATLPGVNVLLTAIQHRRLRKAYRMEGKGDFVGDCVRGVCCCCCMLAQDEKEMRTREVPVAKTGDEGYQRTEQMRFAPAGR